MRISLFPLLLMLTYAFLLLLLPSSSPNPLDESCLTHFFQSISDPSNHLHSWTRPVFSNPCSDPTVTLPGVTCNNGRVYKLSLQNLNLKGSITPFISNCTNLQSLDLSNNTLTGSIPVDLQFLVNLAVLNLSSNHLSGSIPPSLSMCSYINIIDLHDNSLTGPIPFQLGGLVRLTVFDVSDNKLSGPVPGSLGNRTGTLPRFNASSFKGNKGLYGYPLGPMRNKGLSVLAIVAIGLGSGLLSLVLSFTVVCVWLRSMERKRAKEEEGKVQNMMPDY